jgi:hypothetical protein
VIVPSAKQGTPMQAQAAISACLPLLPARHIRGVARYRYVRCGENWIASRSRLARDRSTRTRHTLVTKLAESGAGDQTVMDIARWRAAEDAVRKKLEAQAQQRAATAANVAPTLSVQWGVGTAALPCGRCGFVHGHAARVSVTDGELLDGSGRLKARRRFAAEWVAQCCRGLSSTFRIQISAPSD